MLILSQGYNDKIRHRGFWFIKTFLFLFFGLLLIKFLKAVSEFSYVFLELSKVAESRRHVGKRCLLNVWLSEQVRTKQMPQVLPAGDTTSGTCILAASLIS